MNTYKEAVEKCVNWWIEKSFNTFPNQDNGDDTPNGGISFALMNMRSDSARKTATPKAIEKFKTKLTELLMNAKSKYDRECDVDYHPNRILSDACEFAGIDSGCLPCKTFTVIENDFTVTAKYQYGGEFEKL